MKKISLLLLLLMTLSVSMAENYSRDYPSHWSYEGEDIHVTVPLYRFKDNVEGRFIERVADSIACNDKLPFLFARKPREIRDSNLPADLNEYMVLHSRRASGVFDNNRNPWDCPYEEITGAFLLTGKTVGLIFDASEQWLANMNLVKTDDTVTLNFGLSYRKEGYIYMDVDMILDTEFTAILHVEEGGKVNPLYIYQLGAPIQESYESVRNIMDWIPEYYESHGLPAGCGFYDQKRLNERQYHLLCFYNIIPKMSTETKEQKPDPALINLQLPN